MTIKIDPGAQVNTMPQSSYQKLFPQKVDETRFSEPNSLNPTSHTWISHDRMPKSFLGHFVAKVQHTALPRSYPVCFYIFEDATSPQILQIHHTYTSERLGILEFKVPNLAAQSQIDTFSVPSSPAPGGMRKTTKHVTFHDPLIDLNQPCSIPHPQGLSSLRKTASLKVSFQESASTINGTQCKSPSSTTSQPIPALNHMPLTSNFKTKFTLKEKSNKVTSLTLLLWSRT